MHISIKFVAVKKYDLDVFLLKQSKIVALAQFFTGTTHARKLKYYFI